MENFFPFLQNNCDVFYGREEELAKMKEGMEKTLIN
jgi:hypothetical protein